MPLIPELTFVDGEYRPAVGSLATAAAPARAQQGIARGLAIASDTFGEVAEKVRRIEDNGSENRAFLAFQKARDDHDAFRLANPDEAAWESDLDKRLSAAQTEIGKLPMSPEARTEINGRVDLWSQQAKAGTVEASLKQKTARARQDLTNALERDRSAGDFGSARERLGRSVATGTLLPEEAEADLLDLEDAEKQWSREQTNKATLATITEDASAWLRENPPEKLPEGVDAATYANQQSFARGVLRGVTHDRTAIILDGMASGEVTTPEQVEELAEELRPTVVEELKGELAKRADLRERERRATPEYQNQTIGRATAMIRDWRRDEEGFDETYAQIYTMIAQVEDPGAKEALMDQLGEARDGQKRTLDTNLKLANEVLSDAYKAGRFGDVSLTGKATMKTRAALDDGLLTDTGKLMRLGFTEEQAAEISAEKLKPHERVELYRTMFSQRQGVDQTTPFERAAFLAVRDGNTEFEVDDPESQDEAITARTEADERLGAALLHMKQFARANPTASKREYEDEVYRIAGEETRKRMQSTMLTPRPGVPAAGPQGAFSGTATAPVGKSLKDVVKHFEAGGAPQGFHPKAYWDFGQWSIGYGTKAEKGETITQAEAEKRLDAELSGHRARVEKAAAKVNLQLAPHEVDALTSFDYNTGEIERLLAGGKRSKPEIAEAMLLYRNAKGQRLAGLERRRRAERELFLKGYDR